MLRLAKLGGGGEVSLHSWEDSGYALCGASLPAPGFESCVDTFELPLLVTHLNPGRAEAALS